MVKARRTTDLNLGSSRPAIIDIGSNTVRLVVFDRRSRSPIAVFNEKSVPALGRGLEKNNSLNPEGVEQALTALSRFCALTKAMGVSDLTLLATAAIRDAEDGPAFAEEVKKRTGHSVTIVAGKEEAAYSAYGVLAGIPDADGLMGDLGGGSLELVALDQGKIGEQITLPLGPLRLIDRSGGDLLRAQSIIDVELGKYPWLRHVKGRHFFPVGGTWRSLAKIHMAYAHYPLHIIHEYRLPRPQAARIADILSHIGGKTLGAISGINKKRIETLPFGALVMERLLHLFKPEDVVFSAYGLREGYLFSQLTDSEKNADPLLVGCRDIALAQGRFNQSIEMIEQWLAPLFPLMATDPAKNRLISAAIILSDLSWQEHPDYRSEHAFARALRAPIGGINHPERVLLATALAIRYGAQLDEEYLRPTLSLIDEEEKIFARQIGSALRLAYSLSAGATSLLQQTSIRQENNHLILTLPKDNHALFGEAVSKRLNALAQAFGKKAQVE